MIKNLVYLAALTFSLSACGGDTKKEPEAKASETKTEASPPPVATRKNGITQEDYEKGLALVASSDCLTCHKLNEKLIGPAYTDISNRYTAHPDTMSMLATKIIKGGAGNWGPVQMTPHPQISKENAVQMVKYILAVE